MDEGKITVDVLSGEWEGTRGAVDPPTGVQLNTLYFQSGGKLEKQIPQEHNIFFYVVKGELEVNGEKVATRQLVEFANDDERLQIAANAESTVIFGHARPFEEPVVAKGPFVMNSEEEIMQAFQDYQQGKFGTWVY